MQPPSWYFHRLRSMEFDEILWRIRALLGSQIDLVRMPLRLYPRLSSPQLQWAGGKEGCFGFATLPVDAVWNPDAEPFRQWSQRLAERANEILRDRLSYFDLDQQSIGDPIDWHRDWSAGKHSPQKLSVLIDYRDFKSVGDCKLVWEPNRHHQFVVLARAYKSTGNKEYAEKVVALMLDWIAANPVGYGMNWKSPLELAIRLINWVWAIDLIRDSGVIDAESWSKIVNCIYVTEWDVQRKFSEGSSANNHLIGEAAGVYIATSYLPHLPHAAEWRRTSRRVLEREILNQTFSDGCTKEHAFGYQFFVLQFLSLSAIVARRRGSAFSDNFMNRLHEMYLFLANICSDTDSQPNMGDADSGYVLDLGELPDQARELIAVGGYLFDDPRLNESGRSETAFWLFGNSSLNREWKNKLQGSKAYRESGYFVLRTMSSQVPSNKRISVFFDCAELGYGSIAAHGHADCLSFTLNVGQYEFLVDSGTYDYFSFPKWRQYFRTTKAHNTVAIDDQCQSVSLGPFLWGARANAKLLDWSETSDYTEVSGEHDGYRRLADPVTHGRTVRVDNNENSVAVVDRFDCAGKHVIRRYFHLAAECEAEKTTDRSVTISRSNVTVELETEVGCLEIMTFDDDSHLGWVSPGYHVKRPSSCIVITNQISGPAVVSVALNVHS